MKGSVFFVTLLIVSLSDAAELRCRVFDKSHQSLEQYCKNYNGTVSENCSEQIQNIDPDDVIRFIIRGCDQNTVSEAIKTFKNVHELDISQSDFESLDWLDLRLHQLTRFNASHNQLTGIPSWFFRNTPQIKEIDLSYNQLAGIDIDAFQRATKLTKINLSNNRLHTNEPESFAVATNLESVDLRNNRFWDMPILFNNKHLKTIHLEENPIRNFSCSYMDMMSSATVYLSWKSVKYFSGAPSCQEKYMSVVRDGDFEGVTVTSYGKRELHCKEQSFELLRNFTAGRNSFENIVEVMPCFSPSIETINLADNFVGTLNSTAFKLFHHLNRLSLSNTNLTDFNLNMLVFQEEMFELDISNNNLKQPNNFALLASGGWEKLREFNVAGNQFESIPQIIQFLKPHLKKLDLSGNFVGKLNVTSLERLASLETLGLSNTSLVIEDVNPFQRLNRLSALDISHNNLEKANITAFSTTLRVLSELRAANCHIKNASEVIQHLGPLTKRLDLSGNYVGGVHAQTFELFFYLKHLNLSNSNITTFENDTLQNHKNLQTLDLSNNALTQIDLALLASKLELLNLENNNLTKIDNLTVAQLPRLESLRISQNQLPCDFLKTHLKHEWKGFHFIGDPYDQKHGENCFLNYTINAIIIGIVLTCGAVAAIVSVFGPIVIGLFKG